MSSAQLEKFALVKPAEIEWRDGLPFSLEFDDVYFSIHGAVEESTHVFIEGNQLTNDWSANPEKNFTIAELGFGSGLNFFNTALHWEQNLAKQAKTTNQQLHYIAIEKRPFSLADFKKVSKLWGNLFCISEQLIRHYPSISYGKHQIHFPRKNLTLTLMFMPLEHAFNDLIESSESQQNNINIDHWFLDGFSPIKNSSMWGEINAEKIAKLSKPGTRLATYSVAASVKNPLINAGFVIIKQKGFAKKREMLTAVFSHSINKSKPSKYINIKIQKPWFNISSAKQINSIYKDNVAIIGAGIAGCATALALSQKGFSCDIFDSHPQVAQGASAAAAGIFHPQLTQDMNINSQFNWLAYMNLLRFLSDLTEQQRNDVILNQGIERVLKDRRAAERLIQLTDKLGFSNWIKVGHQFNHSLANKQSGCISFPQAAVIDMPAFCRLLLSTAVNNHTLINTNLTISKIDYIDNHWQLFSPQMVSQNNNLRYQHVIFCGGANSDLITEFGITATHTTRGQTCYFESKSLADKIKTTLCEQIYLVPRKNHQFQLGSTFEDINDDQLNPNSQKQILKKAADFLKANRLPHLSSFEIASTPLRGTFGYRLHSNDRMPIVGAAVDQKKLFTDFKKLGQCRISRQSISHYNRPGLWVNTAYGSHGLLYCMLASQHLASLINNDISPLSTPISHAIHPARFFVQQLKE